MVFAHSNAQTNVGKSNAGNNYTKDTIVVTLPKTQNTKIPRFWKNRKSVQKNWIHIEKDSIGYLNYDPCDGEAEQIKITENYITFNWRLEDPETFKITKSKFVDRNKKFIFNAVNTKYRNRIKGSARIIDAEKGVVLWQINDSKWLTAPLAKITEYRKIENVCVYDKKMELEFLPIEN